MCSLQIGADISPLPYIGTASVAQYSYLNTWVPMFSGGYVCFVLSHSILGLNAGYLDYIGFPQSLQLNGDSAWIETTVTSFHTPSSSFINHPTIRHCTRGFVKLTMWGWRLLVWDIMPCSLLNVIQHFGRKNVASTFRVEDVWYVFYASILPGLFFGAADWGQHVPPKCPMTFNMLHSLVPYNIGLSTHHSWKRHILLASSLFYTPLHNWL
jgi:hypothetical protein